MISARAMSLLEGAIDLHVHVDPSVRPRLGDSRELIIEAGRAGMRGLLLKDHDRATVADAWHANRVGNGVSAAGSVCLNAPAGGLNPAAAEAAIQLGVAAVFLPTDSAHNDGEFWARHLAGRDRAEVVGEGHARRYTSRIKVRDEGGSLIRPVTEVIELCAEAGVTVCTGHLSADEVTVVVDECAALGARVVVTHAPVFTDADIDHLQRWADAGALLELVAIFCCQIPSLPTTIWRSYEGEASLIDRVGAGSFVLSTDLGQRNNPSPVEGLATFVDGLLAEGISEDDVSIMTRVNPATALGWETL